MSAQLWNSVRTTRRTFTVLGGLTLWPPCSLARAQYVQKQPVEFDQAINYVNKIKVRNG